jgi:DnaK suppressor protein
MNVIDALAREVLLSRRRAIHLLIAENRAGVEPRELAEIDAALERIARGTYGLCEECGGPIGRQRLRAIPDAWHCVGCSQTLARAS